MRQKKKWSELSPAAKRAIIIGGIAEVVVTTIAARDLRRRPSASVRSPKALWFLSFSVQPIGAPLYLIAGRRRNG